MAASTPSAAAHCSACCPHKAPIMIVRDITDYSVIISTPGSLASEVQAAIAGGWQPLGHPQFNRKGQLGEFRGNDIEIIQALVKYGTPHATHAT